jgi:hypothetical protein
VTRLQPDHPLKLPVTAPLVVWASRVLTMTHKAIWHHTWMLDDGGPDGCYIAPGSLAERLGLVARTVEDYRTWLKERDLLFSFRRPLAKNWGWIPTLPAGAMPTSNRVADVAGPVALRLRDVLDQHLEARGSWNDLKDGDPDTDRVHRRKSPRSPPGRDGTVTPIPIGATKTGDPDTDRAQCVGEGGKGGALTPPASEQQAQLRPRLSDLKATTEAEDGVVARATEKRGGVRRVGDVAQRVVQDLEHRREAAG